MKKWPTGIRILKTDKDEDQGIFTRFSKMIHCLWYDVYTKNNHMDFMNINEVIKPYRQIVMKIEKISFFKPVIQNIQRLKIMTMAVVYEKNPENWFG